MFPCKIAIYLPQEKTVFTHTENIGCGGGRIIVEDNLSLGSVVGIDIFLDSDTIIKCKGKVVWQLTNKSPLTEENMLFDVGLEFVDIKNADRETIKEAVDRLLKEK